MTCGIEIQTVETPIYITIECDCDEMIVTEETALIICDTGPAGQDGSKILTGEGVPDDSLGSDDDFYLDTGSSFYYTKIAGSWVLQGSLQGGRGNVRLVAVSDYDVQPDDYDLEVQVNTVGGAVSINLPTDAEVRDEYTVSDFELNASTHNITVDAGSGFFLVGFVRAQTFTLTQNGQVNTFKKITATDWKVR